MTNFQEDPLDSLLDEQCDDEFGLPEVRDRYDHAASDEKSGDLRHWSAEDFASIYVRFRPHLDRHARRYLSNPTQAEEVVQDAFLYLMTSLPEIDSELGVLKFLKWKIKLLSIDVHRSAAHRREMSVSEHVEYASDGADLALDLERAEDNAVIRLALAKLNPRQRQVLVASVYEEKSADLIAEQLGLTPNATRQLLHRARSAFRKALVGETEVQGKSINQVLSLAAKKAATDLRENAYRVGTFIVLVAVGVGAVPAFINSGQETSIETMPLENYEEMPPEMSQEATEPLRGDMGPDFSRIPTTSSNQVSQPSLSSELPGEIGDITRSKLVERTSGASGQDGESAAPSSNVSNDVLSPANLTAILETNIATAGFYTNSYSPMLSEGFRGISVEVFGGTGVSAFLDVNSSAKTISSAIFQILIDGRTYFAVATQSNTDTLSNPEGFTVYLQATDFLVVDEDGNVYDQSPLASATASVTLDLDALGGPIAATMLLKQNS